MSTFAFVGFQPSVPAGRQFVLYDMLPQKNRDEDTTGDLAKFISLFQETTNLVLVDVDGFTSIADPLNASQQFVEAMLDDLGDPFSDFELDLVDQRRLVLVLVAIYKQKGTNPGMVNAVRFFMGLEISIDDRLVEGTWVLGTSALGIDTTLSGDFGDVFLLNSFDVVSAVELTATQLSQLTAIITYMKPANTHLRNVVQPSTAPEADPWELGVFGQSTLGVTTILH